MEIFEPGTDNGVSAMAWFDSIKQRLQRLTRVLIFCGEHAERLTSKSSRWMIEFLLLQDGLIAYTSEDLPFGDESHLIVPDI